MMTRGRRCDLLDKKIGYSSHGCVCPWSEIKELEVDERENYPIREVGKWEKKYGLKPDTPVIWITTSIRMAISYEADASDYYDIMDMDDAELAGYMAVNEIEPPIAVDLSRGKIIEESDDGDYGYVFIPDAGYYIGSDEEEA